MWPIALIFIAEVLLLAVLRLPQQQAFAAYAFSDVGANLSIPDMVGRGLRPTIDFGYIYGLLPLLVLRGWYAIAGRSPEAFATLAIACQVVTAWGLARFAVALRIGAAGIALIMVAMPDIIGPQQLYLVHCLEPALLVHALAEQARGRRASALALVTACAFVKPSMAYLAGAILLASIAARSGGLGPFWRSIRPAAATGIVLVVLLAALFGPRPLLNTLFPRAGSLVYELNHFGFFHGRGRAFWWPPNVRPGYYHSPVGVWLVGTSILIVGAIIGAWRLARKRSVGQVDEMPVTCALLHLTFVCLFFGNEWSWTYYDFLLVMGLAALASLGRRHAAMIAVLAAWSLVVQWRAQAPPIRQGWSGSSRSRSTAGLWASPEERSEWERVRELAGGHRVVMLAYLDAAGLLFPELPRPVTAYLLPGHALDVEVERKVAEMASATLVVLPRHATFAKPLETWPEFAVPLADFETIWDGRWFRVYRRPSADRIQRVPSHP